MPHSSFSSWPFGFSSDWLDFFVFSMEGFFLGSQNLAGKEKSQSHGILVFQEATEVYFKFGKKHGLSLVQLALGFVRDRPFVASSIVGATSVDQLKEDIDAFLTTPRPLPPEVNAGIEDIFRRYIDPAILWCIVEHCKQLCIHWLPQGPSFMEIPWSFVGAFCLKQCISERHLRYEIQMMF